MKSALRNHLKLDYYRQGFISLTVAVMLAVFGVGSISYAVLGQEQPPQPKAHQSVQVKPPKPELVLERSEPLRLSIPAIQVDAPLIQTGLKPDGSPEVPEGNDMDKPSWMHTSVTPGEKGTSVLLGHVDSVKSGPSVFFNLGKLEPGSKVHVQRTDGKTAVFSVTSVKAYDRTNFPNDEVYGNKEYPALHLITCGGEWNPDQQEYSQNIVAFASLTAIE